MSSEDLPRLDALIKETARRQLTEAGATGLTLQTVAVGSGVTVAEVQPFFADRDELLTALIIDAYNTSGEAMEQADPGERETDAGARLLAVARALREWSFANPAEFALIYGSPVPGYAAPETTVAPASRTPAALAAVLRSALAAGSLTPPKRPLPGPTLVTADAVALFGGQPEAPYGDLLERGIVLWSNLIGLLVFQVFSRTHDSVADQSAFFDYAVAVAAEAVGLTVPLEDSRREVAAAGS
ncbi:TetR/AcrR family transcriptional regulator [Amycolatopsis sp. NPDC051903]|uniref:TetR/AcrR family transcriptional regulator n=1 Tax=Amycolatopsis sp. NPDC051903 TaxID=3363936 RepID=UPI00378D83BE